LIVWVLSGEAVVEERELGAAWQAHRVKAGDFFLTSSPTPYELRWRGKGPQTFQVMHYFIRMRREKARRLLRETTKSVIEVGLEVGYASPSHFAHIFRREVGVVPTHYRGR